MIYLALLYPDHSVGMLEWHGPDDDGAIAVGIAKGSVRPTEWRRITKDEANAICAARRHAQPEQVAAPAPDLPINIDVLGVDAIAVVVEETKAAAAQTASDVARHEVEALRSEIAIVRAMLDAIHKTAADDVGEVQE